MTDDIPKIPIDALRKRYPTSNSPLLKVRRSERRALTNSADLSPTSQMLLKNKDEKERWKSLSDSEKDLLSLK